MGLTHSISSGDNAISGRRGAGMGLDITIIMSKVKCKSCEQRQLTLNEQKNRDISSTHSISSSGGHIICGLIGTSVLDGKRLQVSSSTTSKLSVRMSPIDTLSSWSGNTLNIRSTRPVVATTLLQVIVVT